MAKDLTVTLRVDANQFKTQMDQATRQVSEFGKEADRSSSAALTGFNKFKSGMDSLRGGLTNLFATLAGGGFAAFVGGLINAADATSDLADATGLTIAEIKGLELALNASGGKAENAAKMITKLSQTFEDAFTGSKQAQRAFLDLGFSLDDLNKFQGRTGDLMEETIRKLAALGPGMTQTAAATQIFGKNIAGIDLSKLISEFETGKISAEQFSESIRKAGELSDKAAKLISDMGNRVLQALEPMIDHFNNMEISAEDLGNTFKVLGGVLAVLAAFFAPIPVAIGLVVAGIVMLADKLAPLATIIVDKVNGAISSMTGYFRDASSFISDTFYATLDGLRARFSGIAAAWTALKNLENPLEAYNKAVEESLTASEAYRISQRAMASASQEVASLTEVVVVAKREQTKVVAAATDAWAKERVAIYEQTKALRDSLGALSERLVLDQKLIGVTDQQKRQIEGYAEIEKKVADQRSKFAAQRLTADKEVIGNIDREVAKLSDIEAQEKKNFDSANTGFSASKLGYDQKIQSIKASIDILTRESELTLQLGNIGVDSAKRIKDAEFELQTQALTPREQQIARLLKGIEDERQAKLKSITDQMDAEIKHLEIQLEQNTQLTESERVAMEAKILANQKFRETQITGINEVYDKEKTAREQSAKETADYQQSFAGGWKSAYDNFLTNTASAASAAKGIFGVMQSSFENAFVSMVTTGKVQWKDLVNGMIKELTRLAAQQAFKWILSYMTGGTSDVFAGVAKLLGFADGGYVATNGPVLVGERGPEIVSGIGGRTVIPNDQIGNMGGSGTVNYYITAVDSQSFRQMVARDPEFLYAVTEKGRQRSPMGR